MKITNNSNVSLTLAVWLVNDEYDYVDMPNYISATRLMKPIRHLILPSRIPPEKQTSDVVDYISRGLGNSIHDSIEKIWVNRYKLNLKKLGYPDAVIERIRINPDEEARKEPGIIPVYVEQRFFRKLGKYTIGGKCDMIAEGHVEDNKSTSVWTWIKGGKDDDYILQGSLYKWIAPDVVTEDFIRINFIFTDWNKKDAKSIPGYPPHRVMHKDIPLWPVEKTEEWIKNKISLIEMYKDMPEKDIPLCTDEELWLPDPQYKYYSNPATAQSGGRSTKNFTNLIEANTHLNQQGKGIVVTVLGTPKRCEYCDAFHACTQKDRYRDD